MKVFRAEFLKSALDAAHYPKDRRPEFAFAGRSNVGKSTLLNALLGKKGLAKTSSTPGKTQMVNFFDVNGKLYFVDLPGYGYAKVPKAMKAQWNKVMYGYVTGREPLRLVAALIDARHTPSDKDHHMLSLLEEAEVPTLVIATKMDKLKPSERKKKLDALRRDLGLDKDACLLPFSGVTGQGVRELWGIIDDLLA